MIGRLRGVLLEKHPPQLLLEVAGVGYEVEAPMSTFYVLPEVGVEVTLYTHLVVREDNHSLFGFADQAERRLFRSLIKVTGVGARMALTILSGISPGGFVACVQNQDSAALVKLPGVGKKTAERLIIEMRDRIGEWSKTGSLQATPAGRVQAPEPSAIEDAVSALIALGYKPPEASRMVSAVADAKALASEEIIRLALQGTVRP